MKTEKQLQKEQDKIVMYALAYFVVFTIALVFLM